MMENAKRAGQGPEGQGADRLIDTIREALQNKDIEAFADLYTEQAVLEELSHLNPPSHPIVVEGREAIRERLQQDLLHDPVSGWARQLESAEIIDAVETDDALAFTEVRTYAAGDKVVAQHLAHKEAGRISRDRVLIAWDVQ